jgi:hypothetical protein
LSRIGQTIARSGAIRRTEPQKFCVFSLQFLREFQMNKLIAVLVAGLFATSVFAQTTAPSEAATKAEAKAEKAQVKADKVDAKADAKAEAEAGDQAQGLAFTQYLEKNSAFRPLHHGTVGVIDGQYQYVLDLDTEKGELRPLDQAQIWNLDRTSENPARAESLRAAIYSRFPELHKSK